jgi:hypothetical protein
LFVSEHGDFAAVLLETGSSGHSYPYFVLTRRQGGKWEEYGGSNMSGGWYQTDDDAGVVVFWDDAEGLAEPIEIEFKGRRWPAEVKDGVFFAVWWDELNPGNLLERYWPAIAGAD